EQPVEAQYGCEQGRNPDDPGGDAAQQVRLGADPKRKQDHGEHKKSEDEAYIATLAHREPQILADQAEEGAHQTASGSSCGAANALSARGVASGRAIG